jgi:hypothetical protein
MLCFLSTSQEMGRRSAVIIKNHTLLMSVDRPFPLTIPSLICWSMGLLLKGQGFHEHSVFKFVQRHAARKEQSDLPRPVLVVTFPHPPESVRMGTLLDVQQQSMCRLLLLCALLLFAPSSVFSQKLSGERYLFVCFS